MRYNYVSDIYVFDTCFVTSLYKYQKHQNQRPSLYLIYLTKWAYLTVPVLMSLLAEPWKPYINWLWCSRINWVGCTGLAVNQRFQYLHMSFNIAGLITTT